MACLAAGAVALLVVASCSTPAPAPKAAVDDLQLLNASHPEPGVVSCGQLTPPQLDELIHRGVALISLRPTDEDGTGWEESRTAALHGRYRRIPVAGTAGVTEANARLLDTAIADAGDHPVVVYCASGNRVGALLALRAYYVQGKSPEEALQIGKAGGLTRLEPTVRAALPPK